LIIVLLLVRNLLICPVREISIKHGTYDTEKRLAFDGGVIYIGKSIGGPSSRDCMMEEKEKDIAMMFSFESFLILWFSLLHATHVGLKKYTRVESLRFKIALN